jgi:ComF family protein
VFSDPHPAPGRILHGLAALLFPEGCPLCRQPLDPGGRAGVCGACWRAVRPHGEARCARCGRPFGPAWTGERVLCIGCSSSPPPYDAAWTFGPYEGETGGALRLLKYRGRPRVAAVLADRLLADRDTADFLAGAQALVPVPLHPRRRRERGCDQAEELARALGRRLRRPLLHALARRRPTRPQVGLGAAARRRNLQGAFGPGRGWRKAEGRTLCLIDDVWTTGATMEEAARCLRRARPAAVLAFTAAGA